MNKSTKPPLSQRILYAVSAACFGFYALPGVAASNSPSWNFPWPVQTQPAAKPNPQSTPQGWWQTPSKSKPQAANPFAFWRQPQQATPAPALPFWGQPQRKPAQSNPFSGWFGGSNQTRSMATPNMFGLPGSGFGGGSNSMFNPLSSMSMTNMMAPMMQGAIGFGSPFLMNYAIASMNPTTMTNFFNLMSRPQGGSPFGGFGGFPMGGFPVTGFPMTGFPMGSVPGFSTAQGFSTAPNQNNAFNPFTFFNFNR